MIKIEFDKFIGIDWSGAKGPKQPGLQVAVADAWCQRSKTDSASTRKMVGP